MRGPVVVLALLLGLLALGGLALAAEKPVPVVLVSLVDNEEPVVSLNATDTERVRIAARQLAQNGFVVVAPEPAVGADPIAASGLVGRLELDFKRGGTEFNVMLVPARLKKKTIGRVRLTNASGRKLWEKKVKIPFSKRNSYEREKLLREGMVSELAKLRPAPSAVVRAQSTGVWALGVLNGLSTTDSEREETLREALERSVLLPLGVLTAIAGSERVSQELRVRAVERTAEVGSQEAIAALRQLRKELILGGESPDAPLVVASERGLERLGIPTAELVDVVEDALETRIRTQAAELAQAGDADRLSVYRDYLAESRSSRLAVELIQILRLDDVLAGELRARFRPTYSKLADRALLELVYGTNTRTHPQDLLAELYVESLGPNPSDDSIQKLYRRYPEEPRVKELAVRMGLKRNGAEHGYRARLGLSRQQATALLGKPSKRREELTTYDLAAGVWGKKGSGVKASRDLGIEVWEYGRDRLTFYQDRAVRLLRQEVEGRFLHGVRPGDDEQTVVEVLGPPTERRALLYGRALLEYDLEHAGESFRLRVNLDSGLVSSLVETDEAPYQALMTAVNNKRRGR